MNRTAQKLAQLKQKNRKALIPYITAGDPTPAITVPLMHALVKAGADLIELGVPFSEPMAEGPVIAAAHQRALKHHVTLQNVLQMVAEFRQQDTTTPVILMGYLNPFEKMGYEQFAKAAHAVGVDGALVVDLPPEEADDWVAALKEFTLDSIFLIAPTTGIDRIKLIAEKASGYHYYVSLKGVTGSNILDVNAVRDKLKIMQPYLNLPVAVGFGIRDAESAAKIGAVADGVIVGAALVSRIAALQNEPEKICENAPVLINEMRVALDGIK